MKLTGKDLTKIMLIAGLCSLSVTAAWAAPAGATAAEAGTSTQSRVMPKAVAATTAPAKAKLYITQGPRYDKVVAYLENLPSAATSLNHLLNEYTLRLDKQQTGGYFYHVTALAKDGDLVLGDYLVANDYSCSWRLDAGDKPVLMAGSCDGLLKKMQVFALPKYILKENTGRVVVRLPGALPYTLRLTSLNTTVATISPDSLITPVSYGNVDIMAEVTLGGSTRAQKLRVKIVDEQDLEEANRSSHIPVGIGIGIGSGRHHRGGIGIGIGGVVFGD